MKQTIRGRERITAPYFFSIQEGAVFHASRAALQHNETPEIEIA